MQMAIPSAITGKFTCMSQQIETQIDVCLTERNRTTALFRIILVVPMLIFVATFVPPDFTSVNSYAVGFFILPVALAIVVRQIYPSYLLAFNESLLSLQTRVDAYLLLLTDEYPSIEENDLVSVTFPVVDAKTLNRWLPLVKWFLAIPLYVVGVFYIIYAAILTLFAWLSILFTGNYPERCAEGVVGTIAFWNRVVGYTLVLVTDEYPTFSL
jgi:Mn2+/Fe2+ NRAMP family transporter